MVKKCCKRGKFCGPKCSMLGIMLSTWGALQLSLMGFFYFFESVCLLHDLPLKDSYPNITAFVKDAQFLFRQNSYNCWIAAFLYILLWLFSFHQYRINAKLKKEHAIFLKYDADIHRVVSEHRSDFQRHIKRHVN